MKKEVLSHFAQPDLILFGFLLFFACFIGVCIWVNLKPRRKIYATLERMPFENDEAGGSYESSRRR